MGVSRTPAKWKVKDSLWDCQCQPRFQSHENELAGLREKSVLSAAMIHTLSFEDQQPMTNSSILRILSLLALVLLGCKKEEGPIEPAPIVPPWDIGHGAEAVLGQSDFTSTNVKTLGQSSVNKPWGLAISDNGTLFAIDQLNAHRILRFDSVNAKANGANADGVLGQPDFTTGTWNYGK